MFQSSQSDEDCSPAISDTNVEVQAKADVEDEVRGYKKNILSLDDISSRQENQ